MARARSAKAEVKALLDQQAAEAKAAEEAAAATKVQAMARAKNAREQVAEARAAAERGAAPPVPASPTNFRVSITKAAGPGGNWSVSIRPRSEMEDAAPPPYRVSVVETEPDGKFEVKINRTDGEMPTREAEAEPEDAAPPPYRVNVVKTGPDGKFEVKINRTDGEMPAYEGAKPAAAAAGEPLYRVAIGERGPDRIGVRIGRINGDGAKPADEGAAPSGHIHPVRITKSADGRWQVKIKRPGSNSIDAYAPEPKPEMSHDEAPVKELYAAKIVKEGGRYRVRLPRPGAAGA